MPSNGPGTGARLWTPRDGPQPALWLDAADHSTIDEAAGVVTAWRDKATGNVFAPGNSPTWGARYVNGRPVMDFDGTNDYLASASALTVSSPFTIFAACATDVQFANFNTLFMAGSSLRYRVDNNGYEVSSAGNFNLFSFFTTSPIVLSGQITAGTSIGRAYGLQRITQAGVGGNGLSGTAYVGSTSTPDHFWDGWLGELLIYPGSLELTFTAQIENYLAFNWRIPLVTTLSSPPLVFA